MIDVHCHLNFHAFEKDVDGVIKKAFEDGVEKIINVGTSIESSKRAIELTEKYTNLYPIVGVHPHHADKIEKDFTIELERMVKSLPAGRQVVAIGETGLDYYSYKSNAIVEPNAQKEVFIKQVELSIKLKLPLQIHNRLAGKDIVEILSEYKSSFQSPPGMFHCFSGDILHLRKVLDLGFYVGFDGNITYEGIAKGENTALPDLVKYAPIERIVTETDSPFLSPIPFRGSRNTPSRVIIVAKFIAEIKAISEEKVEKQTVKNAKTIFNLE